MLSSCRGLRFSDPSLPLFVKDTRREANSPRYSWANCTLLFIQRPVDIAQLRSLPTHELILQSHVNQAYEEMGISWLGCAYDFCGGWLVWRPLRSPGSPLNAKILRSPSWLKILDKLTFLVILRLIISYKFNRLCNQGRSRDTWRRPISLHAIYVAPIAQPFCVLSTLVER